MTLTDLHSHLSLLANRARSRYNPPEILVTVYGSARDGTSFCKESGDNFEVEYMYRMQTFSEEEQLERLRYVDEIPGFLYIDLCKELVLNEKLKPAKYKTEDGKTILSPVIVKERQRENIKYVLEEFSFEETILSEKHTKKGAPGTCCSVNIKHSDKLVTKVDAVQCIACHGWPKLAAEWAERERHWPSQQTVNEIVTSCFHVVPNSPSQDPEGHLWMLSFSLAEAKLMDHLQSVQLTTYLILKKVLKENVDYLDVSDPERAVLTTYHLKTILFWACEKIPQSLWVPEKIQLHINALILDLLGALDEGILPNYFIPEQNLLLGCSRDDMDIVWQKIAVNLHKKIEITVCNISEIHSAGKLCEYGVIQMARQKALIEIIDKHLYSSLGGPETDLVCLRELPSRLVAGHLSDIASIVCEGFERKLINLRQLETLEEILSFACGILRSVFVNILNELDDSEIQNQLDFIMQDDLPEDNLPQELKQDITADFKNNVSLSFDHMEEPLKVALNPDPEYQNGYYDNLFTGKIIFDFEGVNALELPVNLIPRILSTRIEDFIFSVLHSKDICDADVCIQGIREEIMKPKFYEVDLDLNFTKMSIYDLTNPDCWLRKDTTENSDPKTLKDKVENAIDILFDGSDEYQMFMVQMRFGESMGSYIEGSPILYPDILKILMEEPGEDELILTEKNWNQKSSLSSTHLYFPLLPYELCNKVSSVFILNILKFLLYNDKETKFL